MYGAIVLFYEFRFTLPILALYDKLSKEIVIS